MRAVVIPTYGGPEVLTIEDVPEPIYGPDEILVDVHHAALNRADLLQRMGLYGDPRGGEGPEIPGMEYAGVVTAVGQRVRSWNVGDEVMGIEAGGCYAERVATHERQALPVPAGLDLSDAAAVPEVFLTAWDALVVQGGLTNGRWALVHAGASGVGSAAIQIAKAISANVAVTCSAPKMELCRTLGADVILERSPADWASALAEAVPGGVDTVLDVVGGDEVNRNLAVAAPKGTIVQVGLMAGGAASVNVGLMLTKHLHWVGTTLRSRPLEAKVSLCQRFQREVLPLFETGALRPVIDRRYPLEEVADAHRAMESNANAGKILLRVR
jgi:NADPH2:quinone reductase